MCAHLDRVSLEFFREYMLANAITYKGLILDDAYLAPTFTRRTELGIECYMFLNLSNLNLSGSSFRNCDMEGVILENANISNCNFIGASNFHPEQFAFSIGFDKSSFYADKDEDQKLKDQIKSYAQTLDPDEYYKRKTTKSTSALTNYLANLTNILDD